MFSGRRWVEDAGPVRILMTDRYSSGLTNPSLGQPGLRKQVRLRPRFLRVLAR